MASYLERLDTTPEDKRWALARGWLFGEPLPFFAELRRERPILALPELTLAARFDDCTDILRQHDVFSVRLYRPKQGDYWMAQDDTAVHWREKSIMRAILDREEIPDIRDFVGQTAATILTAAGGSIDAVGGFARAVPTALVREWFGLNHADPAKLIEWSYWNQIDAFWNQPFDAMAWPDPDEIVRRRVLADVELAAWLATLTALREAEIKLGRGGNDALSRLLKLSCSGALNFDLVRVIENAGGLLIGAVETTSHAVVNVLEFLMQRPEDLARARAAALGDVDSAVDGFVFEAMRFRPAFPYFFRTCERATELGRGTPHETAIAPGTTVLAVTHSAMFDEAALSHPSEFDPSRELGNQFHFGLGIHECLGRAIAQVMIPEIVRQALRLPNLVAEPVDKKGGPVPEAWAWRWG